MDSLSTDWGVYWLEKGHGKVVWSVIASAEASTTKAVSKRRQPQMPLPRRVPFLRPILPQVCVMNDLAVLRRVREALRDLQ